MEHRLVARSGRLIVTMQAAVFFVALPALFVAVLIGGSPAGRVAATAGIAVCLVAGCRLIRGGFGPRPALMVDPGGLTIVHPGVLREPVRIDRTNVRTVRVCRGAPGIPFTANVQRFPWSDGPGTVAGHGWAFDFKNGSMFPTVTAVAAAPTLLVVFRDPIRLPVRRWLPRALVRRGLRLPSREAVHGVMLCVRHPERLEPAVASWGEPGAEISHSLAS